MALGADAVQVPVEGLLRREDEAMQVPSVRGAAQHAAAVHRQRRDATGDRLAGEILLFQDSVAHVVVGNE